MKVINFDQNLFETFLKEKLNLFLVEDASCLVIGIKEGGVPLAEFVVEYLKTTTFDKVDLEVVKCQRPSTKRKKNNQFIKKILKKVFKITPQLILNGIRIIEHNLLMKQKNNLDRNIVFTSKLNLREYDKIIVVDDAVDSGYTLKNVIAKLEESYSNKKIYSLSVVVTDKKAIMLPDYYLYSDVLIRFPWSLDG